MPPRLSPFAAGAALGRFAPPTEHLTRIEHHDLVAWFAGQPDAAVQGYTARDRGSTRSAPRNHWRIAQVSLDAENRIVAARWLEAPAADDLVTRLHAHESFTWWHE